MDDEDVMVSVWEVVDAIEVVVVEGGREDVDVMVNVEDDVDGGADVVENVELDVNDVEMVLVLLVALEKCGLNLRLKIWEVELENVELEDVSLMFEDVFPPASLVIENQEKVVGGKGGVEK
ncbi:hypothetical protein IW262DRAFT_1464372 [Armillaria fumosa]|nr:hypothetical protein IW262DRAFT_1464372 [Armillaria fumosa]